MDPRPEVYLFKENAQRRRLRRKTNKIVNFPLERLSQPCKFFLPNPPPTSSNIRRLRTAPGSPKTVTSSFPSVLWILSSTSIFLLLSHRFSFQVHKTCWKSPTLNKKILAFFVLKKSIWRADFERFLNKLFLTCKISQQRNATSFFYCIFDRQDVS